MANKYLLTYLGTCCEYGVSNDLTKWKNQKYFSTWQSRAWKTGKPGMSYINENSFSRWLIEKSDGLTTYYLLLISSPSFKIGTNLKINLDGKKDEPDVKPKGEGIVSEN